MSFIKTSGANFAIWRRSPDNSENIVSLKLEEIKKFLFLKAIRKINFKLSKRKKPIRHEKYRCPISNFHGSQALRYYLTFSAVSRNAFGHTGTMERLNLFIQTILCDKFKQTWVANTGIHKVLHSTILNALLRLNVSEGVDAFALRYD